jgi:hypothetical protein
MRRLADLRDAFERFVDAVAPYLRAARDSSGAQEALHAAQHRMKSDDNHCGWVWPTHVLKANCDVALSFLPGPASDVQPLFACSFQHQ